MFDTLPFTQSNRLLTLSPGSGLDENALLPYELSGIEGISSGFSYRQRVGVDRGERGQSPVPPRGKT